MMRFVKAGLALLVALSAACSAGDDERMPVGNPPEWIEYCQTLGYEATLDGACKFPDGSACELIAFWRGTCGQAFSYCEQHGGTIMNEDVDLGSFTASTAFCTVPSGARCREWDYFKSGRCP